MKVLKKVQRILGIDKSGTYFETYVQRTNAVLASRSGIAVACVEVLLLINVLLHKGMYDPVTNRLNRAHAISYIVFAVISVGLSVLASWSLRYKRVHAMVLPIIGYIMLAMAYGVFNSYIDALYGEPPLTFIFCTVACTCVFVIPPLGAINLNAIAFVTFYKLAEFSDRFAPDTIFHYWIGWLIVCFVAVLRYQECRYGANFVQQLSVASEVDELTGLRNRRSLRKGFEKMLDKDLFVAMCDLDDFKGINDTFGHAEGDCVLRSFGEAINSVFGDDYCYRYGGDEFLIFSASCASLAEFRQRVALMRVNFATRLRELSDLPNMPTSSVGYCNGFARTEEDLRVMVHIADSSLYEVKNSQKGGMRGERFKEGTQQSNGQGEEDQGEGS